MTKIGYGKSFVEKNPIKRIGYRLFGEIHIPGRIRLNHVLREIERLGLPANGKVRVLDAGCGRGDFTFYLAEKYPSWHVTGIELDEVKYRDACTIKERLGLGNAEIINGDLLKLDRKDEFDLIISSDVLEHIDDDDMVFNNLARALKKGGHLVLTTPSVPQRKHLWLVKWREKKIGFQPSDYGHVRDGYSKEDYYSKLKPLGFVEIAPTYTFGPFGTLAFDIFFVIGDNRPNPLVFALFFPFLMLLGVLDLHVKNGSGSGIMVSARKAAG